MFVDEYVSYAQTLTDAPSVYHRFIAYNLLSAVTGNRFSVKWGDISIYPVLWTVLMGESSAYRKSTALAIGARLLGKVDPRIVLPSEFTAEKFLDILSNQPQGLLVFYEFLSLTSSMDKEYNSGLKSLLTEIFDCPELYQRETRSNTVSVLKPCVSIMTGTTLAWFLRNIKERDLWGGFLPRFIFIPAYKKESFMALPPPVDLLKQNALVRKLMVIRDLPNGEMSLSTDAQTVYIKWVKEYESKIPTKDILTAFYYRLETYAIKFAILEALSHNSQLIMGDDMQRALDNIDWLSSQLGVLSKEQFTFTRHDANRKKVLDIIKSKPAGISEKELTRTCRLAPRELDSTIQALISEEQIFTATKKVGSKTTLYYVFHESN